mmetsp:Transcript_23516/g.37625  ORF Transcript_23516/g.37625 Transcript_23516/m.37625 type:complete len:298 (-) Transcript_23516:101-994(-)
MSDPDPYEDEKLMKAMDTVLHKYDVTIAEAKSLRMLKEYDMIVIADDSGSMRRKDPGCTQTRWDELGDSLRLIISLGACFDEDGIDIYFLNSEKINGVKSADDARLTAALKKFPSGSTPLSERLEEVVKDRENAVRNELVDAKKPVLLMIFTDGVPNGGEEVFGGKLAKVLKAQSTKLKFRCQLFACTGQDDEIAWARKLDDELEELDMTDDYLTEKKHMDATGAFSSFTKGDWCLKAMLGAVDPSWDDPGKGSRQGQRHQVSKSKMNNCVKAFIVLAILGGVYYVHFTISKIKEEL